MKEDPIRTVCLLNNVILSVLSTGNKIFSVRTPKAFADDFIILHSTSF